MTSPITPPMTGSDWTEAERAMTDYSGLVRRLRAVSGPLRGDGWKVGLLVDEAVDAIIAQAGRMAGLETALAERNELSRIAPSPPLFAWMSDDELIDAEAVAYDNAKNAPRNIGRMWNSSGVNADEWMRYDTALKQRGLLTRRNALGTKP